MLILSRDIGQSIIIDGNIKITILEKGRDRGSGQVRIGIEAPKGIVVNREEIQQLIEAENLSRAG